MVRSRTRVVVGYILWLMETNPSWDEDRAVNEVQHLIAAKQSAKTFCRKLTDNKWAECPFTTTWVTAKFKSLIQMHEKALRREFYGYPQSPVKGPAP